MSVFYTNNNTYFPNFFIDKNWENTKKSFREIILQNRKMMKKCPPLDVGPVSVCWRSLQLLHSEKHSVAHFFRVAVVGVLGSCLWSSALTLFYVISHVNKLHIIRKLVFQAFEWCMQHFNRWSNEVTRGQNQEIPSFRKCCFSPWCLVFIIMCFIWGEREFSELSNDVSHVKFGQHWGQIHARYMYPCVNVQPHSWV